MGNDDRALAVRKVGATTRQDDDIAPVGKTTRVEQAERDATDVVPTQPSTSTQPVTGATVTPTPTQPTQLRTMSLVKPRTETESSSTIEPAQLTDDDEGRSIGIIRAERAKPDGGDVKVQAAALRVLIGKGTAYEIAAAETLIALGVVVDPFEVRAAADRLASLPARARAAYDLALTAVGTKRTLAQCLVVLRAVPPQQGDLIAVIVAYRMAHRANEPLAVDALVKLMRLHGGTISATETVLAAARDENIPNVTDDVLLKSLPADQSAAYAG
ncbi:MAG: hypothetical protein H0T42_23160, partial [Deltaproteobacteria bacterium]|nr:hypothetical protein [Deltaproteobacteria bacterium]